MPRESLHAAELDALPGPTGFGELLLEHCASMMGGSIEAKEATRAGYTFALRFPTPDANDGKSNGAGHGAGQRAAN